MTRTARTKHDIIHRNRGSSSNRGTGASLIGGAIILAAGKLRLMKEGGAWEVFTKATKDRPDYSAKERVVTLKAWRNAETPLPRARSPLVLLPQPLVDRDPREGKRVCFHADETVIYLWCWIGRSGKKGGRDCVTE